MPNGYRSTSHSFVSHFDGNNITVLREFKFHFLSISRWCASLNLTLCSPPFGGSMSHVTHHQLIGSITFILSVCPATPLNMKNILCRKPESDWGIDHRLNKRVHKCSQSSSPGETPPPATIPGKVVGHQIAGCHHPMVQGSVLALPTIFNLYGSPGNYWERSSEPGVVKKGRAFYQTMWIVHVSRLKAVDASGKPVAKIVPVR